MPPPKPETTLLGWIEDFISLPKTIPQKTFALYVDRRKQRLSLLRVMAPSPGTSDAAAVISTFQQGEEAFRDLRGVNIAVNINDLIRNPIKTISALGTNTLRDITNLDEIGADRRARNLELLMRGENKETIIEENGLVQTRDLGTPDSLILGAINKMNIPIATSTGILTATGTSEIKILESTGPNTFGDIKTVQENEQGDRQYQTYQQLANSITGIAGYMEIDSARDEYRDEAVSAYNRILMREMGVDLETALPVKGARKILDPTTGNFRVTDDKKGTLLETIESVKSSTPGISTNAEALDLITQNTSLMDQALNLPPGTLAGWDDEVEFMKASMWDEFAHNNWGDMPSGPKASDLEKQLLRQERTARSLEARMKADAFMRKINHRVGEQAYQRALSNGATAAVASTARNEALERVTSATKVVDIANNLHFAGLTKQTLESIKEGTFLRTAFINTQLLGLFPFIGKDIGTPSNIIAHYADKIIEKLPYGKTLNEFSPVPLASEILGIAVRPTSQNPIGLSKFTKTDTFAVGEWLENRVTPAGPTRKVWHQIDISGNDAQGLYGGWFPKTGGGTAWSSDFSVFDVISNSWGGHLGDGGTGQKISASGLSIATYNPDNMFSNTAVLDDFLSKLQTAGNELVNSLPITDPNFSSLAAKLGLDTADSLTRFTDQLNLFNAPQGGKALLQKLHSLPGFNATTETWKFLIRFKGGHLNELATHYLGPLQAFGKRVNQFRSFLYKQVIFGGYGGSNPFVHRLISITKPLRDLLSTFGMGDETLLTAAISKWRVVKPIIELGYSFQRVGSMGLNARGAHLLAQVSSSPFAGLTARLAVNRFGQVLLKTIGRFLAGAAGILSGGIGFVVSALGVALAKAAIKIIRGDLSGAFKVLKDEIVDLLNVAKKVILYPIIFLFSCILGCAAIVFILIFGIIMLIVNLETPMQGGAYSTGQSTLLTVDKRIVNANSNEITFEITIRKSQLGDPVTIQGFTDRLSLTPSCSINSGQTIVYGDPQFIGKLDNTPGDLAAAIIGQVLTDDNPSISIQTTLSNISNQDSTYSNFVEVISAEEPQDPAIANISHQIGQGGCSRCPSGWPINTPIRVLQGPNRFVSTHNIFGSDRESIDLGAPIGDNTSKPIFATHNGVFHAVSSYPSCASATTGYGCYYDIRGDDGITISRYAHLVAVDESKLGSRVQKGDVIGIMGTTGNSNVIHIHYQFPNSVRDHQCIPSHPLRMEQVQGDQYIPQTLPGCGWIPGFGNSCNIIIN